MDLRRERRREMRDYETGHLRPTEPEGSTSRDREVESEVDPKRRDTVSDRECLSFTLSPTRVTRGQRPQVTELFGNKV